MGRLLELFAGTQSVGDVARSLGWEVVSVDVSSELAVPTIQADILTWDYRVFPAGYFDVVWASPPCTRYSYVNSINLGKAVHGRPFTQERWDREMCVADELVARTLRVIDYFAPVRWYVENPYMGHLRNRRIMESLPYFDVDYCRYADWGYRKRTRIWSNHRHSDPRLCDGACGSMRPGTKRHRRCAGGARTRTKRVVGKRDRIRSAWGQTTLRERYRVPPELVRQLWCDPSSSRKETPASSV